METSPDIASPDSDSSLGSRHSWDFLHRHALFVVLLSPILANVIGSIFNILYNQTQVEPLLSPAQMRRFYAVVGSLNLVVYPVAVICFVLWVWRLRPVHRALLDGQAVDRDLMIQAQRRVINLPWGFLLIACAGWLICIPVFPIAIASVGEPLSLEVITHLVTSFLIASLIAVTHSFFAVELATQRTLFPVFFQHESPASVPEAITLGIRTRGLLWTFSAVVGPVVSLLLILLVPDAANQAPLFAIAVGSVAIAFGFTSSWLLGRLVVTPIAALKRASQRIADGDLNARVEVQRADEFGLLIDSFNSMVEGLRQRERLMETFGRHVGQEAARQILRQGDEGAGRQQEITVMFVDVRNFTDHSSRHSPEQVLSVLNVFFAAAVERIEANQGMVNKYLGDGLMAIFGVGTSAKDHADQAVQAARDLRQHIDSNGEFYAKLGWPGFSIGMGINGGSAVVGSVGSPRRQEYTAMGDVVNVAARVESLTKRLGQDLLITSATRDAMVRPCETLELAAQTVKGKSEPIRLFAVPEKATGVESAVGHQMTDH